MLHQIHYENLQEGIFLLEFKMNQPYAGIIKMPYHIATKQVQLYSKYQAELAKSIEGAISNIL